MSSDVAGSTRQAGADVRPLGLPGRVAVGAVIALSAYLASADPFALMFTVLYGLVGWYLVYRRPRNVVGWLLVAIAVGFVGIASHPVGSFDIPALRAGTSSWPEFLGAWYSGNSGAAAFTGIFALTVVFPDGQLPTGRARRVSAGLIALGLALTAIVAFGPVVSFNPDGGATSIEIPNRLGFLAFLPVSGLINGGSIVVAILAILAVGVAWMLVRYRRSSGILRLQLRWLVAAIVAVVLGVAAGLTLLAIFGDQIGGAAWLGAAAAFPTIPIAIAVAVLRYRLWNIDTIINRAIVYALVTAILAGVTATVVGLAEKAFQVVVGPGSDASILLSTLIVVSVFEPIKRRVSAVVDRRFRETQDPAIPLGAFVAEARAFLGPLNVERTLERFAAVAHQACRGSSAAITWTRDGVPGPVIRSEAPVTGRSTVRRWWARGGGVAPDPSAAGAAPTLTASARAGAIEATMEVRGVVDGADRGALAPAFAAVLAEVAKSNEGASPA